MSTVSRIVAAAAALLVCGVLSGSVLADERSGDALDSAAASSKTDRPGLPPAPTARNLIRKPVRLDAQAKADLEYMIKHTKRGVPHTLDMRNPVHYRHILRLLTRAGETPERSPMLFQRLKLASEAPRNGLTEEAMVPVAAASSDSAPQAINYINSLHTTGPQAFSGSGLSSVPNGTQTSTVVMSLYGYDNQQQPLVYASNTGTTHTQGNFFEVATAGTMSAPITGNTTLAEGAFAYVPQNATSPSPIVTYYQTADTVNPTDGCMLKPQYCVRDQSNNCIPNDYQTACTNKVPNTTPIKACWNRGSQGECDYWNAGAHPANYFFPIQGNATFSSAIYSPPQGMSTIVLINPAQGGGCYLVFNQLSPLAPANWTLSNNNTTLNWNFDSATFPNNGCLNYQGATNTYLNVQVDALTMSNTKFGAFVFTSDRSQLGLPGTYIIPVMQIQDGCFAAGTSILLADGTSRPIEDVRIGDVVRSGDGAARAVVDVTTGTEPHPMYRLATEDGRAVFVTETHPIATPKGLAMVQALGVGDTIRTTTGTTRITSITTERYDGRVFNLRIGDLDDAAAGRTMLVADGLLTGDAAAQTMLELAKNQALVVRAEDESLVHPDWREDFRRHRNVVR